VRRASAKGRSNPVRDEERADNFGCSEKPLSADAGVPAAAGGGIFLAVDFGRSVPPL
jgi:hypothetical protein